MPDWVPPALFAAVLGLITTLLAKKDAAQAKEIEVLRKAMDDAREFHAKQIALLFSKHDEDSSRLDTFQLKIASDHYVKHELDMRFDKLEAAFSRGFAELGGKFDRLSDRLLESHNGNGYTSGK